MLLFFKYCFLLYLKEKNIHTHKKKKEKKRRERLGHNQAHQMFCITAQAQSSFWGWRKPKGTEDMPGCLPPPHHKVFKAPKCYTDSQILPATRSILFTVNNKAKHVLVVFQTQITVFVHLPQTQDKVPFWFKLQLTAQERRFFLHIQLCHGLPWGPWASQPRFITKQKGPDISLVFSRLVWFVLWGVKYKKPVFLP